MSKPLQADPPRRPLPRREQHHGVERPRGRAARSSSTRSCTSPRPPSAAKFDFFFLAEGLRLREQGGQIYDLDVVGRPDTFTVLAALAAVTDRPRPGRHDQLHLQRAVRGGPPVRHPRPPVRGPGRVERGHLLGRVHRRELPPRRLPRRRTTATRGPRVPAPPRRAVGLLARRRDRRRPGDRACSCADADAGAVRPPRTSSSTSAASSTCRAARRAAR